MLLDVSGSELKKCHRTSFLEGGHFKFNSINRIVLGGVVFFCVRRHVSAEVYSKNLSQCVNTRAVFNQTIPRELLVSPTI